MNNHTDAEVQYLRARLENADKVVEAAAKVVGLHTDSDERTLVYSVETYASFLGLRRDRWATVQEGPCNRCGERDRRLCDCGVS